MPTIIKDVTVYAPGEDAPDNAAPFVRDSIALGVCHVAVWTEDGTWFATHRDGTEPRHDTAAWWPDVESFHRWIRWARS